VPITVRGTSLAYTGNVSTYTLALPAGAAAGDICYVLAGHGFAISSVASGGSGTTAWTQIDNLAGSNYNGATYAKVLDAADVSSGSVTVNFGGSYYGTIALVVFVGSAATIRTFVDQRSGVGVTSRTLTTDTSPQINDYAAYFGAGRGNTAVASANGTLLQSNSNLESSSVLAGGLLAAAGSFSNAFTFGAAPSGDYEIILVVKPVSPVSPGNGFDAGTGRKTNTAISNFGGKATSSGAGGAITQRTIQGKTYVEFTATAITGTPSCGLASTTWNTSTDLKSGTNTLAYLASGAVQVNGVTLSTIAAWAATNRIGMAVDPANRLVWFRVNGGNWNNNVANDPATGVGGIDYTSAMTGCGTLVAAVYATLTGNAWDLVAESALFVDATPTGFSDLAAVQYTKADSTSPPAAQIPVITGLNTPTIAAPVMPQGSAGRSFSPGGPITVVSGTTKEAGVIVTGKVVEVYDRNTGDLLGRTTSDGSGNWSIPCLGRPAVRVVGSDPTTYNSLVYDNVTPV
jgi:hypothetical protein